MDKEEWRHVEAMLICLSEVWDSLLIKELEFVEGIIDKYDSDNDINEIEVQTLEGLVEKYVDR